MIRKLTLACAFLAFAACSPTPPGSQKEQQQSASAPSQIVAALRNRAPDHPSQSHPTAAPTRQIQITAENRRMVEANILELLNGASQQFAAGKTQMSGTSDVITAIQPAADHQFRVDLQAGTAYTMVGVCDADCNDVDLELLDGATGAVVESDLLQDDVPVLNYTPGANSAYFVRVILVTCTQAPCYVGARVLQGAASK